MAIGWIYLLIASLSESIWIYAVKGMDVQAVKDMGWSGLLNDPLHAKSLLPFLGYAVFGAGNVIFLSMSMRTIPASTAFAAWMAVALVSTKLIDTFWFKEPGQRHAAAVGAGDHRRGVRPQAQHVATGLISSAVNGPVRASQACCLAR